MSKVGLITFHAAHNYGSVLQAYATAEMVNRYSNYDCEVVNYRPKTQKEFYALFPKMSGIKGKLVNVYNAFFFIERKKRFDAFEGFIKSQFRLTSEFTDRDELSKANLTYDIYLSGSDQIWSDNVAENANSQGKNTGVYFWDFVKEGNKRSYAPSVGSMTFEQIEKKKAVLESFSYLSTREQVGSDMISKVTGRHVDTVMDPTLLLEASDWKKAEQRYSNLPKKYMLLYTVGTRRRLVKWIEELKPIAKQKHLRLVILSPLFSYKCNGITFVNSAGPAEFINIFSNAECVVADSFHGTAFSIIFRKPFYVLGNKYHSRDIRKLNLLNCCGLSDRLIEREEDLRTKDFLLDYSKVESLIQEQRRKSLACFEKAIEYNRR